MIPVAIFAYTNAKTKCHNNDNYTNVSPYIILRDCNVHIV